MLIAELFSTFLCEEMSIEPLRFEELHDAERPKPIFKFLFQSDAEASECWAILNGFKSATAGKATSAQDNHTPNLNQTKLDSKKESSATSDNVVIFDDSSSEEDNEEEI